MGGRQMLPLPHLRERYLATALTDYGAECRIGDRAAMVKIDPLSNEEIAMLSYYPAHLDQGATGQ